MLNFDAGWMRLLTLGGFLAVLGGRCLALGKLSRNGSRESDQLTQRAYSRSTCVGEYPSVDRIRFMAFNKTGPSTLDINIRQPPYQKSILNKTRMALGLFGLCQVILLLGGGYYIGSRLERINRSVVEFDQLSQDVKTVDEYFIRQAKDRKNLLLRGHNPRDREKYWSRINEMTVKIQTQVDVILENPLSQPYHAELNTFMNGHSQLMTVYHGGVKIFQETQSYTAGDQYVRGKGNDVGEELTQVLQHIQSDRQRLVLDKEKHIQQFLVVSTSGLILVIVICSGLLAAILTDPIRRIGRFTRFLDERHAARQANQLTVGTDAIDVKRHPTVVTDLDHAYRPEEGPQQDEIGYMFESYSKLASIISDYNQQLRIRDGLLNCVNAAAHCLVANDDLTVALPAVLQILGEGTRQGRAYILQNSRDDLTNEPLFNLLVEWDAPGVPTKEEAGGQFPVPIQTFPDHLTAPLEAGHSTQFLASELEGLEAQHRGQARSLVGVPIMIAGEWWGLLGLDDCLEERVWSEAEIAVLETAATSIGSALERDLARQTREASEREALMAHERAARTAELEKTNQILSSRERWLETTAAVANELLSTLNVEASVNAALQMIGENLGCDRIVVLRYIPDPESLGIMNTIYEWVAPGISSQLDHPELRNISNDGLERWFTQLMSGHWVGGVVDSTAEDGFSLMMKSLHVKSTYNVPIFIDEEFWGVMALDHCQAAKCLSAAEIAIFKTAATCVGSAICRDHMRSEREKVERSALLGEERNRLAREIHDTLAQAFTGVSLQLEAAKGVLSKQPTQAEVHMNQARDLAHQGLSEARRSVRSLRSQALETDTLAEALQKTLGEMTQGTSLMTQFQLRGSPVPLPEDIPLNLLRIGQEAITNALRHSQAQTLSLTLTFAPQHISLRILDDGIGFDAQSLLDMDGFGLMGIRERAAQFEGHLQVTSDPAIGTAVEVTIPLE